MAYRIQQRRDTRENWESQNPILAGGEIGIIHNHVGNDEFNNPIYENTNLYKIGNGRKHWNELPLFGFDGTLSQTLDVNENEPTNNEAVSKSVLVEKFNSLDEALEKLSSKEDLQALSKKVEDNKTEFDELSDLVDTQKTTLETIQSDMESLSGTVTTQGESITNIEDRLDTVENQHIVLSQTEYNNKLDMGEIVEGVLYYVYEETE